MNCGTCRHFKANPSINLAADGGDGMCWRYPPTAHAIATPQGILQLSNCPPVKRAQSCGEYAARVEIAS